MSAEQYGPPQPVFEPRLFGGGSHVPLMAPWLQPHERLLGIVEVKLSDLIRRPLPRELRTGKQRTGAVDGVVEATASVVDAVEFFDFGIIRRIRRGVRGAGLTGGWQSMAGWFAIAVRTGPDTLDTYDNERALMVFTDRRILLMCTVSAKKVPLFGKVPPGQRLREARCLGELLPGQLLRVVIRHTSLSERVDLHFTDGSLVAVEATKEQARALEALSRGIVPPPRS
ncbi:hypothetical protein ABZ848_45415 [Streptomyces sp. NPDC047081]|uniref:hypothetical protein n=1 Tax=Streptomyces sp. NPDC047081 TaxID=3154706 RepID=UPI0033C862A6